MAESAFAVNVPEAEPYVADVRAQFDPSAALGAPAHITILYPFMPPGEITQPILDNVGSALSSAVSFTFSLVRLGRFPDTLHLVPEPAEPFVELTMALTRQFPKYLPYGGRYSSTFPHLTIAQAGESDLLYVEEKIAAILPGLGGIRARCEQLVLIENSSGLWKLMHTFPLVR